jgi:hypothetical protein
LRKEARKREKVLGKANHGTSNQAEAGETHPLREEFALADESDISAGATAAQMTAHLNMMMHFLPRHTARRWH